MKKLLVAAALLLVSAFVFANESIVDNFWKNGKVVKIVEDNTITYVNKSAISIIEIVKDEIRITNSTYNFQSKANWTLKAYAAKKYDIVSDDDGNIVITKK